MLQSLKNAQTLEVLIIHLKTNLVSQAVYDVDELSAFDCETVQLANIT